MKWNRPLSIGVFVFSLTVVSATLAESPAETKAPDNQEMSYGGVVLAVPDTPVTPFFAGHADDADLKRVPNHPPIDQIPPMPMPPIKEAGLDAMIRNLPQVHDTLTGETTTYDEAALSGAGFGFGGGWSYSAHQCRSAQRGATREDRAYRGYGFRVARSE